MNARISALAASVWLSTGCNESGSGDPAPPVEDVPLCAELNVDDPAEVIGYHGDARGLGWQDVASSLRPGPILSGDISVAWSSAPFHSSELDGVVYPPLVYGPPLYADNVDIEIDDAHRVRGSVAIAATTSGWIYAIAAAPLRGRCSIRAGSTLWHTQLVDPMLVERLDGGVPLGVLSTPRLDLESDPPRVYVAALDAEAGWLAFAVSLTDGEVLEGWPVAITDAALAAANTNGPARFWDPELMSQRGALQVSPSGDRLYIPFGTFWGDGTGWLIAIDTEDPSIASAFSSAPHLEMSSSGGIWGSGGPAIDADGGLYVTTGNSPPGTGPAPDVWGSSLLHLSPDLELQRAYSPFNYCTLDDANMDLGASQPLLVPPLHRCTTPHTVAFGGKQGNVYLVDREAIRSAGSSRPACDSQADLDKSLLPPDVQPQFGTRGPLNVFGPYSDEHGQIDHAKMRTKLAAWVDTEEQTWLFATGSSKRAADSTESVAPSIAKLRVVDEADAPAYLEIDRYHPSVVFQNPGSPVVTSYRGEDAVVWVLDRNAPRTAPLLDPQTPGPILYAFEATTLTLLWRSDEGDIGPIGKYGTPTPVHDQVLLATDRLLSLDVGPATGSPPPASRSKGDVAAPRR